MSHRCFAVALASLPLVLGLGCSSSNGDTNTNVAAAQEPNVADMDGTSGSDSPGAPGAAPGDEGDEPGVPEQLPEDGEPGGDDPDTDEPGDGDPGTDDPGTSEPGDPTPPEPSPIEPVDPPTEPVPSPDDWTACSTQADCVLTPMSCCGDCGAVTPTDAAAVNVAFLEEFRLETCGELVACLACFKEDDPRVGALCDDGQCVVELALD